MGETILEMQGITKEFPGVKALDNVTFKVKKGEIHAICGENGAGKSTLMKVLSGVHPHGTYKGQITYEGKVVKFHDISSSEKQGIVIIHQELALSPFLSIAENIFLGNEVVSRGLIDWEKTNSLAAKLLEKVGLSENPITPVSEIGVGKQQLVEIAKALSKDVKLLILDEPTAALNDTDSAHLLDLIRSLRDNGITCIIISHKLNEIEAIADSTTILRDGQTIETLDMKDSNVTEDRIIQGMVGREMSSRFPTHETKLGKESLRVENWNVWHPVDTGRQIVKDVSLNVHEGEIVGLAGLMGAGRTEFAMSVFGRSYGHKISGSVFKDGQEISLKSVSAAIEHGIAYVTEDRKKFGLNLIEDIKTNITISALHLLTRLQWINLNKEISLAERLRTAMNIKCPNVHYPVGKLSGGNQQKVVLSKWIHAKPDVLILDEPTRGIDVGAKYEIYQIMNEMAGDGKSLLVISSELPELMGVCDRIYTLCEGEITGEFLKDDCTQELLMKHMTSKVGAI